MSLSIFSNFVFKIFAGQTIFMYYNVIGYERVTSFSLCVRNMQRNYTF